MPRWLLKNRRVEIVEMLARAVVMVPPAVVNDAGMTAADTREYLNHNEWEVVLDILTDLCEGWQPTVQWWDLLLEAANLMRLPDTAARCRWGRWESIHGIIRAELRLLPPTEGGRTSAIPRPGMLRPLWDTGQRTAPGNLICG